MSAFQVQPTQSRRFRVKHATSYQYSVPIERSVHRLHLRPIHDWKQRVVDYKLDLKPDIRAIEYEDAFGNFTTRYDVSQKYTEMSIVAESTVELLDGDPFAFTHLPERPQFPVSWMPWDHKMLSPYLTSAELPETQLMEIHDYAMSFVERNNNDLMETLFDINLTMFREFQYVPGSTNLATTPYDVLVNKRGVCQDFTNLFITMTRLLRLPSRYVCGYVYTGNHRAEWAQNTADATHAWVQLYIPNVGWKDFDPTNGILPSTEHVRLAVGRHFRDTAPVTGTLYTMAQESMQATVEMIDLDQKTGPAVKPPEPGPTPQANSPAAPPQQPVGQPAVGIGSGN